MIEKFLTFGEATIFLERYFLLLSSFSSPKKFKYSEGHHVFPKYAFGKTNDIVFVSYRVHFLMHELLWKHFRKIKQLKIANKAAFPLIRMRAKISSSQNTSGIRLSSRAFELAKVANVEATSGENNPMFGRKHSEESKVKISLKRKGVPMPESQRKAMIGRKHTESARKNMKLANRPPVEKAECDARSQRMKLVWQKRREGKAEVPVYSGKRKGTVWNKGLSGENLLDAKEKLETNRRKRKFD